MRNITRVKRRIFIKRIVRGLQNGKTTYPRRVAYTLKGETERGVDKEGNNNALPLGPPFRRIGQWGKIGGVWERSWEICREEIQLM